MVKAVLAPNYRATTLAVISLVSLIAFEAMAVATAMPTAARSLDGIPLYGVAFGATMATAVVGMVISGEWCDMRGPSAPLAIGVVLMVLGLIGAGAAVSIYMLIFGRALQGVGFGMVQVAIYVLIGRRYPTALHPMMFAALSTAWALPSIIGPSLAGFITVHFGWRWVFLVVPLLAVPAIITVLLEASRTRGTTPREKDDKSEDSRSVFTKQAMRIAAAFMASIGIGLLHIGGHSLSPGGMALTLVALAVIGFATARLLPAGTTRLSRGLPTVFALRGLAAAAFFSTEVFLPLLLIREHDLSPLVAGIALTLGSLGWTAGSWIQARIDSRYPAPLRLRFSYAALACGIAVVACAVAPGVPWVVATAGWILAGLGMGNLFPSLAVLMLELSPRHSQGANSAALQLCDALGTATTFAVSGAAFAALIATNSAIAYLTVIGFAVFLAGFGAIASGRVQERVAEA